MAKIRFFILVILLCSNPVSAIELDQLQINSFIHEPLNASVAIIGVDEVDLADIRFTVASKSEYRKLLGTKRPAFLNEVKVDVVAVENGRHELHIVSSQRVREPILTFLLKVIEKQGSVFIKYNLLLDPRIEPAEPLTPVAVSRALAVEPSASKGTGNKAAPEPIVDRKDGRQTIVVRDKSISIIAQDSTLHDRFSVYQIMRAFYMENPQAFEYGNIDKLMSGSTLLVPPESLIGEVPRRQAINFVRSVSIDNVTQTVSAANANQAGVSTNQLEPPAEIIGVLYARETSSQSSVTVEAGKAAQKTLPETIQGDIKSGRGVANELLASQQSGGVVKIDSAPLTNPVGADQKNVIANDQSPRELVNQEPLQSAVINESPTPQLVSTNAQDSSGFSRFLITLMGTVAIGIALFFALRGWALRRRIKEQSPVVAAVRPVKQDQPTVKKKPSSNASSRGNSGSIELKDLSGSDRNSAKSADVTDISRFKLSSRTVDEVKLECDTLIAYELYSEALQLVCTARDSFGDNPWFDVKELEVLASSGQCDEFFALFDQYRIRLEQELPECWHRIENLRQQMHEDFKIAAVQ